LSKKESRPMPTMSCPWCQKAVPLPEGTLPPRVTCPHCGKSAGTTPSWFVARGNQKVGPYNRAQLQALARRGELKPDDMVLQEGSRKWCPASEVPKLFPTPEPVAAGRPAASAPAPRKRRRPVVLLLTLVAVLLLTCLLTMAVGAYFAYRALAPQDSTPAPLPAAPDEPKKEPAPEKVSAVGKIEPPPAPETKEAPPEKKETPPEKKPAPLPPPEKKPAPPPPEKKPPVLAKELTETLLRQLNTYRKTAGLERVGLDADLTRGCAAHAKYLALNFPTGPADPARLPEEEPGKPGFSEEGRRAGEVALISLGEPHIAVGKMMARLHGRLPLLQTGLRAVGLGLEPLPDGGWVVVLDALRGVGAPVVLYPAPGQEDVPLTFAGGMELPDPNAIAGYPVTAAFPLPRKVTQVKAELLDEAGKPVDAWVSSPEKPAHDRAQRNTVALIAKAPLQASRVYRVQIAARLDGEPWSKTWAFATEDDADARGIWAKKALDRVNAYRKQAGVPPVVMEASLSQGCRAHARYLALNLDQPAVAGLGAHDEDPNLPGFSEEGRKAGKASDIAIGDHGPLDGIDAWMATLYHRVPLLEPNLKAVGYGCARARRLGWVAVMNVSAGKDRTLPRPHPVFYPAPDQAGVPLHFPAGGEEPNPIPDSTAGRAGFPVTAFFPETAPLKSASAVLTDPAGKEVAVWFSTPEVPANPKFIKHQGNTVCLIPRDPLKPNTTYHVVMRGRQGDKPWDKEWRFTTASGGPTPAQAAQEVLGRVNSYRATAGLAPVRLDPLLAKGCQAHAEYLVRNTAATQKKVSGTDEDSALPGFTPEGKAAARRSDIFSQAPEPVAQVDDLMGTVFRRVYLLDPELHRIGFGCANDVGRGWRCVLDLVGGRGEARVVLYPAPDQDGVPRAGRDRLPGLKDAPGFPISATFPAQVKVTVPKGTLTDAEGRPVDVLVSTPEQPLEGGPQRNTVCLHPRTPLRPGSAYRATVSAMVNGQPWRQEWQFTTE
jgi:uncharacterized protein YkwD